MANTIYDLPPSMAESKTTAYPDFTRSSDASGARAYLAFAVNDATYFPFVVPQGAVAPYAVILTVAAAATTGNTNWDATVEVITPGDALNTATAEGLDTPNVSGAVAIPASAGVQQAITIPLTTYDDMQPGDRCRLRIRRIAATGELAGMANLFGVELRDSV